MRKASSVFIALVMSLIAGVQAKAQEHGAQAAPSPEHKRLAVFVGTWKEDFELKASATGRKFTATEKCEWFAGGFTVICHNEMIGSDLKGKGLQIMTYEPEEKVYKDYEFDDSGNNSSAVGTIEGDTWTWRSDNKIRGKIVKTRVTMKVLSPDSIATKTETLNDDGTWTLLSESKRNRVK
jgi:hypothetical protein